MLVLLAGLGAIIGSILRFVLLEWAPRLFGPAASWMAMAINLTGALLIGYVFGLHLQSDNYAFIATGILGGYTTFSAPIVELADGFTNRSELGLALIKTIFMFGGGILFLLLGIGLAEGWAW